MKKNIISILLTWVLAYALTAFVLWELSPAKWDLNMRVVYVVFCVCQIILIPMIIKIIELDE